MAQKRQDPPLAKTPKSDAPRMWLVALLFVVAVLHVLYPAVCSLDWQAVTLILVAVLVAGFPQLAKLFQKARIRVGEFELELERLAAQLQVATDASEEGARQVQALSQEMPRVADDMSAEDRIADIASRDKGAAVLRLASEIERELNLLAASHGIVGLRRSSSWSDTLAGLAEAKVPLPPRLDQALRVFRQVRNRTAHGGDLVPEPILNSTLDSGMRLLHLLRSVPRA